MADTVPWQLRVTRDFRDTVKADAERAGKTVAAHLMDVYRLHATAYMSHTDINMSHTDINVPAASEHESVIQERWRQVFGVELEHDAATRLITAATGDVLLVMRAIERAHTTAKSRGPGLVTYVQKTIQTLVTNKPAASFVVAGTQTDFRTRTIGVGLEPPTEQDVARNRKAEELARRLGIWKEE